MSVVRRIGTGLAVGAFFVAATVCGQEPVVVRTSVVPEEAWIGQRVTLALDVLGRDGWAHISGLDPIRVPGAYLLRNDAQGIRLQESILGQSYTGQRYEFSLYPQRQGPITIPPVRIDVQIQAWGGNEDQTVFPVETPEHTLVSKAPPGTGTGTGLVTTPDLSGVQAWEPDAHETVMVGDAIQRTIRLEAEDVSGMAFLPLSFLPIEGVGIYPGSPEVEDKKDRGTLTGTRTERLTYVFERPGTVTLPEVTISWWEPDRGQLHEVVLAGREVSVQAVAAGSSQAMDPGRPASRPAGWGMWILALVLVGIGFGLRYRSQVRSWWIAWEERRTRREAYLFRAITRGVSAGDPRATLRATMAWLDQRNDSQRPARLDTFLEDYGDPETRAAAARLMDTLGTAQEGQSDLPAFGRGMRIARSRWRRSTRRLHRAEAVLPGLNP